MPQLVQYIDAIAREKQRGVLFIQFRLAKSGTDNNKDNTVLRALYGNYFNNMRALFSECDYENDERRTEVLQWLDAHGIPWQKCAPLMDFSLCRYMGDVYLDIPYDEQNEQYQLVCEYLENPDGSMRDERVTWYYLPLERAMQNAYQDEPGYWDEDWDA